MAKFNLKKQSQSVTPYPKRLVKQVDDYDIRAEESKNYTKLLEPTRKNPEGDKNYEKLLNDGEKVKTRVESSEKITDGQLEADSTQRHDDGVVLMDMAKTVTTDKDPKAETKKSFWDAYVGDDIPEDQKTKTVGNTQTSQLLSNYDTREEFEKSNPSIKKNASANQLLAADALLYHTYRVAATENRELNETETKIVERVNKEKMDILESS